MKTIRKISLCLWMLLIPLFAVYAQNELKEPVNESAILSLKTQMAINKPEAKRLGWKINEDELKLLSLRKPITSVNTSLSYHKVEYLVDGLQIPGTTTYKWYTSQNNASFVIDLQRVCKVYEFVTYDCQVQEFSYSNVVNYNIYVGLEDALSNKWMNVVSKTGGGSTKIKADMISPVEARYIRYEVQGSTPGGTRMYEFEVWGEEVGEIPDMTDVTMQAAKKNLHLISYDKPVIPDTSIVVTDSLLHFGKNFTGWKATKAAPYFIVDLEKVYDVSRLQIFFGDGVPNYTISTCEDNTDGFQWKLAGENTDRTWYLSRTMIIQPEKARYVKFEVDAADVVMTQVNDFEVWGCDVAAQRQSFTMKWVWMAAGVLAGALLFFLLFVIFRKSGFRF